MGQTYITGWVDTSAGNVPQVSTQLTGEDKTGAVKARLGIGRMRYKVEPGLYAVGSPDANSPVFITANYKLSFDTLRSELGSMDGWIVVLDTKGINVWCAAGKGTFGTDEMVRRIELTRLAEVVETRQVIVPQLGAPGVAAHEVRNRSGFSIVYGPVRARDLRAFVQAGMRATPQMRRVRFDFRDRLVLVPMEVVGGARYLFLAVVVLAGLAGITAGGYSLSGVRVSGPRWVLGILLGYLGGTAAGPLLLPYLPARAFSVKGLYVGLIVAAGAILLGLTGGRAETAGWVLLFVTAASFGTMNFTGASTYTSLSGVKAEMRFAVPLQALGAVAALALLAVSRLY